MKQFYSSLNQIGYTCGIYCLEIANSIVVNSPIKLEYIWPKNILNGSFASKFAEKVLIHNNEILSYRQKYKENIFKKAKEKHIINIGDIDQVNMQGKCLTVSRAFKTGC